jgi:hypothetical protein
MVAVKWTEFIDAFEFASFGAPHESRAFVNLDTGSLHCISDVIDLEEETPEDLEVSDRYLALPHKNDLTLAESSRCRSLSSSCRGNSAECWATSTNAGLTAGSRSYSKTVEFLKTGMPSKRTQPNEH